MSFPDRLTFVSRTSHETNLRKSLIRLIVSYPYMRRDVRRLVETIGKKAKSLGMLV
jgi:hypothetical protein